MGKKLVPTDAQKGRIIDLVINQGYTPARAGRTVFPNVHRDTASRHAKLILGEYVLERTQDV